MRNSPNHAAEHPSEAEPARSNDARPRLSRAASRRVVLKAAAGMAALTASGIGVVPSVAPTVAQQADGTRARRYNPAENGVGSSEAAQGEWVTFQAEFPFWALGASWPGDVGSWPVVAVQLSQDGATWTETIDIVADIDDGGQPTRDDRLFTSLIFTDGAQWVRYQTVNIDRVPGEVEDLSFVYIDPTDGPWEEDLAVGSSSRLTTLTTDTIAPPEIITRAQWGANESWRFASFGEIWPPEYETVTHIIVHHTATANRPADVPNAIRSIYYYHAVEQGWGDIGYNYLVDHNGRIYQGRFGGQNVIGGHSFQFAIGSSGISTIGNFQNTDITEAAKSALVSICAWVGRDLDPLASGPLQEAPNLPIIASHRDVNATTCPGDRLWNDLPELRQLVAQTLDQGVLDTDFPAGIAPGDRVRVQTDDGAALNLRSSANGSAIGSLADDATAWVIDGPEKLNNGNWYRLDPEGSAPTGWATAQYLIVEPPLPPGSGSAYPFGLNLRFTSAANIRRSPSTSSGIVGTAVTNSWGHVLAGPVNAEGFTWYQVRAQNIGDGWVVSSLIAPAPVNENPNGAFAVGANVEATQTINLRPRPGLAQGVISTLGAGSRLVISQPAFEVTGFIWYGVYSTTVGGGWVVQDYLRATGAPPAGKFQINDTFRVSDTTNLRSTPTTGGSVLLTMAVGTTGTVVGGPRSANGYTWWQVRLANGTTGWCIENWLVETDGGTTPPPSGKFQVNDTFRVTETMNLRSAAGTSASVVVSMPVNTRGTVTGGPTSANGYTWWSVRLTNGTTGWAAENWMEETDGGTTPPPPSGKFQVNDTFRVTQTTNLRSSGSTGGSVVTTMTVGTTGTVIGGPTSANGYTWWNVRLSNGTTGWCIENWLVETDGGTTPPPTGKFQVNDTFRVTDTMNLRSSASTSASVVASMPTGTTGTVTGGPTSATGYTWWNVRLTSGTTGWAAENWMEETDGGTTPPPPGGGMFENGDAIRVTERANLRTGAGTSNSVITVLQVGQTGTVIGGPTNTGGFIWWNVQTSAGTGWVIEDVLVAGGGTTPPPSTGLPAGTVVRVTEPNLRMRSAGNTSGTIIAVLPQDARLTIVSGPTAASGYDWYQVTSATAGTGYVADDFIARV